MSYWEDSFDLLKNAAAKQKAGGTAALPKLGTVNYGGGTLPKAAVSRAQALPALPQKAGEGLYSAGCQGELFDRKRGRKDRDAKGL